MKILPQSSFTAFPTAATRPPEKPDNFIARAEESGAQFYERKRFHFPWSEPSRPLQAEDVAEKLSDGRVEAVTPESPTPVRLATLEDVGELATLQSNGNARAQAVHSLAEAGWRFHQGKDEVGAYGAYHGTVEARNGDRSLTMQDPEKVWKFYAPAAPAPGASLENDGYRFYRAGKQVAAYEAGPSDMVGRKEGWLRSEELIEGQESDQLQRFARLRVLATSVDQARIAFAGDSLDALLASGIPVKLAMAAAAPGDAELWSKLPELRQEALLPMAERSPSARLALDLMEVCPNSGKLLAARFSEAPPNAADPYSLQALGRELNREQTAFARVLLARMLDLPSEPAALLDMAQRVNDRELERRALEAVAARSEYAALKERLEAWSSALTSDAARHALYGTLMRQPQAPDSHELARSLMTSLREQRVGASERGAFAAARLKESLDGPTGQVAEQARMALDLGQDVTPALDNLKRRAECAGLKARLESWGPVVAGDPDATRLMLREALGQPEGSLDPDALLTSLREGRVGVATRGKLAAHFVREELAGSLDIRRLAARARTASSYGETAEVGEALEVLKARQECAHLAYCLESWGPALTSSEARKVLEQQLLSDPLGQDGDAERRKSFQTFMSTLRDSRVDYAERGALAAVRLRQMVAEGASTGAIAEQALLANNYGQSEAVTEAEAFLAGKSECQGMQSILSDWEGALSSETARRVLHQQLLTKPLTGDDQKTRQALYVELLSALRDSRVEYSERAALAVTRLDELMREPVDVALASEQIRAVDGFGQREKALAALEQLEQRPECASIKALRAAWEPALRSDEARALLRHELLSGPADRQQHYNRLMESMRDRRIEYTERADFAVMRLHELQDPLDAEAAARQAIAVSGFGRADEAHQTLDLLARKNPALQSRLDAWAPALSSAEARRVLHEQLLSAPGMADDTATRDAQFQQLLNSLRDRRVEYPERGALVSVRLDEVLAEPLDVHRLARAITQADSYGRPVDHAVEALLADGSCAGIKRAMAAWGPALSAPGQKAMRNFMLLDPTVKEPSFNNLLEVLRDSQVDFAERAALTEIRVREVLAGPTGELAAAARKALSYGREGAALEGLETLAQRPECAGLADRLAAWGPRLTGEARKILHEKLLESPTQTLGATDLLQTMRDRRVDYSERGAFAGSLLQDALGSSDAAVVADAARAAMSYGQPVANALERLGQLPGGEGVRYLNADWRWEGMSADADRAVSQVLLTHPGTGDSPEERERLGAEVLEVLPASDRARFREVLAEGSIRRSVEKLANPDRTTQVAEGDQAVVIGGVVVKKR